MCFNDNSAFGDGSEKIIPIQEALGMQVEEFEVLEEVGIEANVGEGFELNLVKEFGLKAD